MRSSNLLLIAILVFCSALSAADWPMHRYDAGRTAASPTALPTTLYLQWVKELPALERAWPDETTNIKLRFDEAYAPVIAGSIVYIASSRTGSVTAYDTETGKQIVGNK